VPVNYEPLPIDVPQPRHATLAVTSCSGTGDHRLPPKRGADERVLASEHRDLNVGIHDLERPHGRAAHYVLPPPSRHRSPADHRDKNETQGRKQSARSVVRGRGHVPPPRTTAPVLQRPSRLPQLCALHNSKVSQHPRHHGRGDPAAGRWVIVISPNGSHCRVAANCFGGLASSPSERFTGILV